jgi:hypothetical protein
MKRISFWAILLSASSLLSGIALAQNAEPKCLEGIEFFTGYGWGKLHHEQNFNTTPFIVDFDFDLKPLVQKLNLHPKQLLQFQIEPFASFITSPDNNVETGVSFFLKTGFLPQTSKIQPFILAGAGLDYMTQHTKSQSTQFNFTEQFGIGFHYFFRENIAFTLQGRIRHLSNCDIRRPNIGINTQFVIAGVSYKF